MMGNAHSSWNAIKCKCACESSDLDECAPKCETECKKSKCAVEFQAIKKVEQELEKERKARQAYEDQVRREIDADHQKWSRGDRAKAYEAAQREALIRRLGEEALKKEEETSMWQKYKEANRKGLKEHLKMYGE
jgi:hypothetical protein